MPNKETLRQQATELNAEVVAKSALFEKGDITAADFSQYIENAEKQNEQITVSLKSLEKAKSFRGASDSGETENPGTPPAKQEPEHLKKFRDGFAQIKSAAAGGQRAAVGFDFGMKSVRDDATFKTQGITGLQGENVSGTTAPGALSGYFLGGSAGPFITPEWIPGILELPFYENVIAQLFPSMPVSSPVVSYVREASWTNNAAAVAEGSTKPTSTNSLTRYTEEVGKIANLVRVTDELIQDAAYLWALIQRRLVQGVQRKEEVELLAGTGMPGANGLLNRVAGFCVPISGGGTPTAITNLAIPASGTAGAGVASDTIASVTPNRAIKHVGGTGVAPTGVEIGLGILASITDIRVKELYEPDAVVMNPLDYMTVRITQDNNGQFMGGGFFGRDYGYPNAQPQTGAVDVVTLWGKKTVTTPAMPAGLILVGDFGDAGAVLRLGGLRVDIANQNGTDFEQNLWTARAEERVGLMVERPELFQLSQLQTS